jgi:hypothetical protein
MTAVSATFGKLIAARSLRGPFLLLWADYTGRKKNGTANEQNPIMQ